MVVRACCTLAPNTYEFQCTDGGALQVMYADLEIAEVIGRGCSSFVLRARHIGTNKPLALKVRQRRRQRAADRNALGRGAREAERGMRHA